MFYSMFGLRKSSAVKFENIKFDFRDLSSKMCISVYKNELKCYDD